MKTKKRYILTLLSALLMAAMMMFMAGCGGSEEQSEAPADDQKVAVGISWCEDINQEEHGEDLQAYINTVEKAGGEPVLLDLVKDQEEAKAELEKCDVLVMTGGDDIDPAYYGQEPIDLIEGIDEARDTSDMALLQEAIDEDMPVLCTCRGCQLLNVLCGGTLIQDIPTSEEFKDSEIVHRDPELYDFTYHDITIEEDSQLARIVGDTKLNVNSWHHQGIGEVGDGLKVTATSADGMIEGLEREDSSYVIGVQFHPEWHVEEIDDSQLVFFTDLMDQVK